MEEKKNLEDCLAEFARLSKHYKRNLLHNYGWRDVLVEANNKLVDPSYEAFKKNHGFDYKNKNTKKGETKTSKSNKFEFDKQNDPIRRERTKEYESFLFVNFSSTNIEASIYIDGSDKRPVAAVVALIEKKQKEKIVEIEDCERANKRLPRDSITLKLKEIKEVLSPYGEEFGIYRWGKGRNI